MELTAPALNRRGKHRLLLRRVFAKKFGTDVSHYRPLFHLARNATIRIAPGRDAALLSRGERYLPQQHVIGLREIKRLRVGLAIALQRSCRPVDLDHVPIRVVEIEGERHPVV